MTDEAKFNIRDVLYKTAQSRQIGRSGPPQRVGVLAAVATCECGTTWNASVGAGMDNVLGGVLFTCPSCHASATISGRTLGV